jgi:predicted aspartyl protease
VKHARLASGLAAALTLIAAPAIAGCVLTPMAELKVAMVDYAPLTRVKIDGRESRMIVDSGSSMNILALSEAEKLKVEVVPLRDKLIMVGLAGGQWAKMAMVKRFTLGGDSFKEIPFIVIDDNFGPDVAGLLGDNFLTIGDQEYDLAHGAVRIFQPRGCGKDSLAYWAADGAYSVVPMRSTNADTADVTVEVLINGLKVRAVVDSGAATSVVSFAAARRAGIDISGPDVVKSPGWGKGRSRDTWIAPVASFQIGDERILHTRLRIGDLSRVDNDMLLGADFLMSHRVLVSESQGRLYFSYVGGPAFNLGVAPRVGGVAAGLAGGLGAGQVAGGNAIQGGGALGSPR